MPCQINLKLVHNILDKKYLKLCATIDECLVVIVE